MTTENILTAAELNQLADSLNRHLAAHAVPPNATPTPNDQSLRTWIALHELGLVPPPCAAMLAIAMAATGHHRAATPLLPAALLAELAAESDAVQDLLVTPSTVPCFSFCSVDPSADVAQPVLSGNTLTGTLSEVEFADHATHLVIMLYGPPRLAIVELKAPGVTVKPQPGLARPAWCNVSLQGAPTRVVSARSDAVDRAQRLARIALSARALGAARRTYELAVEYTTARQQFGQPIGRFQSMQHRMADVLIQIEGLQRMADAAAQAHDQGSNDAGFFALATFVATSTGLRPAMLELHHSFGAIGYSEEHEAPQHFRRVHADLALLGGLREARIALGRQLLARAGKVPAQDLGATAEAFRQEVRVWLAEHWGASQRDEEARLPVHEQGWYADFTKALAARGWIGAGWANKPKAERLTVAQQFVLLHELGRANAPVMPYSAAAYLIAPALIRFGSPAQQAHFLPRIERGEVCFCLGYSEPNAGSDLASLRTTARRDGDSWVINGQKLWATGFEHAQYIWLAARTDPDAKAHAGISVFIVPLNTPGITSRPSTAFYGHNFTASFYDGVRVGADALVGQVNQGWKVITSALADERLLMGANIAKTEGLFELLCQHVAATPTLRERTDLLATLGEQAAQVELARQLVMNCVLSMEAGLPALHEAGMCKVFSSELMERLSEAAIDIVGAAGLYEETADSAVCGGRLQRLLRTSIMMVIGGGTNDIQRNVIATRGIGLPR